MGLHSLDAFICTSHISLSIYILSNHATHSVRIFVYKNPTPSANFKNFINVMESVMLFLYKNVTQSVMIFVIVLIFLYKNVTQSVLLFDKISR